MFTKATYHLFPPSRTHRLVRAAPIGVLLLIALAQNTPAQRVSQGSGPNTQGQVEKSKRWRPHPTDAATIYVGAVNGGIWETTIATAATLTWIQPLGGNRALSIGAIAFDPTDATHQTLIAGVGRFGSFLSRGSDRARVWCTTDGGTTWSTLDLPQGLRFIASSSVPANFKRKDLMITTRTNGLPDSRISDNILFRQHPIRRAR